MYLLKYLYHNICLITKALFCLKKTEKTGEQYVHFIEAKYNGKLEKEAIKKAAKFQSIQQHLINDNFTGLYGRNTNEYEQTSNRLYFIMSGLYDDILDNKILSVQELDKTFEFPEKANQQIPQERLLATIHLKLLTRVNEINKYKEVVNNTHLAQKDSTKQFNKEITLNEILDITKRKGGYSLLMCRHYLNLNGSITMDNCWYNMGGVIQMTNDLFDIYKDLQDGIQTFANTAISYESTKALFDTQVDLFKNSIRELDYSEQKKQKLLIQLSLIPAFGYIALDNLKHIQQGNLQLPSLSTLNRKQLIIDMEQPKHILKLLKYAYLFAKN
jgi:hypothetical protein